MPRPGNATLTEWDASTYRVLRAAAAITRQAHAQPPSTRLPATAEIAAALDVSPATVLRAKRLLATAGILRKGDNNRYHPA